jgi:hypothetical protein
MLFWRDAVINRTPLGDIDRVELERILEKGEVYYIAAFIITLSGEDPEKDATFRAGNMVRHNIALEVLRRRFAPKRPKLFPLRDLPVSQLHEAVDVTEKEFMLGLAYMIRQETGREITAEEAAERMESIL